METEYTAIMLSGTSSFKSEQSVSLAPSKETHSLIMDSLSRPADVFLPTWSPGRPAALDVHVISPLQQQTLGEAAFTPGHALHVGVWPPISQPAGQQELSSSHWLWRCLGGLAEDSISILHFLVQPSP